MSAPQFVPRSSKWLRGFLLSLLLLVKSRELLSTHLGESAIPLGVARLARLPSLMPLPGAELDAPGSFAGLLAGPVSLGYLASGRFGLLPVVPPSVVSWVFTFLLLSPLFQLYSGAELWVLRFRWAPSPPHFLFARFASLSQRLHGTAIYADQLEWLTGGQWGGIPRSSVQHFYRVRRRTSNSGVFLDLVRQFFQVTLCGFSRLCILCGPHFFEGKSTTDE